MWARIVAGQVVELTLLDPAGRYHESLVWAPCDATVKEGYAALSGTTGWTYSAPPPPPPPTPAQQAAAAVEAGLAVTSTGAPALNGTYPCDATTQSHLMAELMAVQLSGGTKFADGGATVLWPDLGGAGHTFTPASFQALAVAVGAYVANLYKVINGSVATLPPATATIP